MPLATLGQVTRTTSKDSLPLLELGAGVISVSVPDYPGASRSQVYTFPFPTGLYRGETLRADEDAGIRGRFIQNPNYELSFSGSLTFSSRSDENPVRSGMPDLDGLGEFGPSLIIRLKRSTGKTPYRLSLALPLRYAISTDWKRFDERGFVFNPFLFFVREKFLHPDLILFSGIDIRWATEKYMDYYYQVDPQYVTSSRPYYDAKAGYLQTGLYLGMAFTLKKKHTFFSGVQHLSLNGAQNEESPLLVDTSQWAWAIGYSWWFYESELRGSRY